ncbi:hypothetical protein A33M_0164 [Rhodovulum sp. PH10]|nr:hypothetical protein A33M_0164 [Rhodovulum sp. PH10]
MGGVHVVRNGLRGRGWFARGRRRSRRCTAFGGTLLLSRSRLQRRSHTGRRICQIITTIALFHRRDALPALFGGA